MKFSLRLLVEASHQVLDDLPQPKGLIDTELMCALKLKEEEQLLFGPDTGQNFNGPVAAATAHRRNHHHFAQQIRSYLMGNAQSNVLPRLSGFRFFRRRP